MKGSKRYTSAPGLSVYPTKTALQPYIGDTREIRADRPTQYVLHNSDNRHMGSILVSESKDECNEKNLKTFTGPRKPKPSPWYD